MTPCERRPPGDGPAVRRAHSTPSAPLRHPTVNIHICCVLRMLRVLCDGFPCAVATFRWPAAHLSEAAGAMQAPGKAQGSIAQHSTAQQNAPTCRHNCTAKYAGSACMPKVSVNVAASLWTTRGCGCNPDYHNPPPPPLPQTSNQSDHPRCDSLSCTHCIATAALQHTRAPA